jgi:hypothetical protein
LRWASRRRGEGPVAAYAGILDGRHLWLTLESGGTAELHGPGEGRGQVIPLGEVTDLLEVPHGDYRVLCEGRPVWAKPFPPDPIRIPVSPDGRSQLELGRDDEGHLSVRRRETEPTALLEAIELREADVHLTLVPPGESVVGTHLLLLDGDDETLDQLPVTARDGRVEALVGVADLPAGYFGVVRLALGTESSWVRIRRRHNDLADPHRAVLLPELHDATDPEAEEDWPRARFRWNPASHLVLRVLDPDYQTRPGATVTPMAGRS